MLVGGCRRRLRASRQAVSSLGVTEYSSASAMATKSPVPRTLSDGLYQAPEGVAPPSMRPHEGPRAANMVQPKGNWCVTHVVAGLGATGSTAVSERNA